jgi:hypothetical protein
MSCTTPTRPLESSAKRLLKRVHMCTERSFECTPIRYATSKRKTIQALSSTLSSGITLLSIGDQTLVGDNTIIDNSLSSLDRTLTENNNKKVSSNLYLNYKKKGNFIYFRVYSMIRLLQHLGK